MDEPEYKDWVIREMHKPTRRRVAVFAAQEDTTIAKALKRLIEAGLDALEKTKKS